MKTRLVMVTSLFALIVTAAHAQWQQDGVPLCTDPGQQYQLTITPDGAGGAIAAWQDDRNVDIYVRRIDANGVPQWTADGVAACVAPGDQSEPQVVSDGAGGAFVVWNDPRNGTDADIYAQHVNSDGVVMWAPDGVAICTQPNEQSDARIASDGTGGAVITWLDDRAGINKRHVYAQRVGANGTTQWTSQGVAVCTASTYRGGLNIVSDSSGFIVIAWEDWYRVYGISIYAQQLDLAGNTSWQTDGIQLDLNFASQAALSLAPDGFGGAIAVWQDSRNPGVDDIYAQHVSVAGNLLWGTQGIAVCLANGGLLAGLMPRVVSDGEHGGVFAWLDYRNSGNPRFDVYAQHLDENGNVLWTPDGVQMCGSHHCNFLQMASDGSGGAVMAWEAERMEEVHVVAQRVDANGTPRWAPDGVVVCGAGNTELPVVAEGPDPIIAWVDGRTDRNVYASVAGNTPIGSNVALTFDQPGGGSLTLTFDNVTTSGGTTVASSGACSSLPGTFQLANGACLEIHTDATFTGSVQLCFTYDDTSLPGPEADLRLMHFDGGWNDITTYQDTFLNTLCGTVTSLSPFALATQTVAAAGPIPTEFTLLQNIPNPFNPQTTIHYDIPAGGADVNISIYDVAGRLVREFINEHRAAGTWSVQWNGDDANGQRVASGVYFYRMRAGSFVDTKKMVLLK